MKFFIIFFILFLNSFIFSIENFNSNLNLDNKTQKYYQKYENDYKKFDWNNENRLTTTYAMIAENPSENCKNNYNSLPSSQNLLKTV